MSTHTHLWQKYKAQDPQKCFGCDVEGRWHLYNTWLEFVKKYCEDSLSNNNS